MLESAVLEAALAAHRAGLYVLPPKQDGTKAPGFEWADRHRGEVPSSEEEIRGWYANGRTGLGLICGRVSGGLELLDFDLVGLYDEFADLAHDSGLGDLLARVETGYSERTPHGMHLLYRCQTPSTVTLASMLKEDGKPKTLIETKGEGGYVVTAPSHGRVNADGDYVMLAGGFDTIVTLTMEERDALVELARTFDELRRQETPPPRSSSSGSNRPGDDFARRTTWAEILEPHGWARVFERSGETFWRRPGKEHGISATTGYSASDTFKCFSTSTIFETTGTYTKIGAYAALNHGGDLAAAARDLGEQGFGEQRQRTERTPPPRDDHYGSGDEPMRRRAILVTAANVEVKEVEFLWERRVPLGKVVVVDGDPNMGKSTLVIDLGARMTAALEMPDGTPSLEGEVIYLSYEDDAGDTIKPRLLAAGGDPNRFHLLEPVVAIPDDVAEIEDLVQSVGAKLLVIDPLMAALGMEIKSGIDHHIRRALAPLKELAERQRCTVLFVRHLNKNVKVTNPLYRGGGSIGIIGAARAGMMVCDSPERPGERLLVPTKSNLCEPAEPLRYRVVEDEHYQTARIEWLGTYGGDASDLSSSPSAVSDAVSVLIEILSTGRRPAKEVEKLMAEAGFSKATTRRAKLRAGVRTTDARNAGGKVTGWVWELPERRDGGAW